MAKKQDTASFGKRDNKAIALEELNRKIDSMVEASKAADAPWSSIYQDGRDYIYNNQLVWVKNRGGWDRIQANLIWPSITQELALLAQRRPKLITGPWEEGDTEGAKLWKGALQWQYEKGLKLPRLLHRGILDGKSHGHWVVKVYWEERAEWSEEEKQWVGAPRLTLMPPEFVGLSPGVTTIEEAQERGHAYCLRRVSVEYAKQRWPEYADEIDTAAQQESQEEDHWEGAGGQMTGQSSKSVMDGAAATDGEAGEGVQQRATEGRLAGLLSKRPQKTFVHGEEGTSRPVDVTLLEMFFHDAEEEDVAEDVPIAFDDLLAAGRIRLQDTDDPTLQPMYVDSESGEPITEQNRPTLEEKYTPPKFPNGRRVLRIGKTVMNQDDADQVWDYHRWPLFIGHNNLLPHTWHGLNAVEMARGMQDARNIGAMHMLNYVKHMGDPVVFVEEGAVQNKPQNRGIANVLQACAGAIWKLARGGINRIKRDPPPPMSPGTMQIWSTFTAEERDILGMQEVGLGRKAGGQQTAHEVMRLETNTRLRTALQSIFLDEFTVDVMSFVHELCKVNMAPGQMLRIIGEQNADRVAVLQQTDIDARFDLSLEVTTTLPFDTERTKQDAAALFGIIGMPYLRRLLEAYDVHDIDELLQATQAWQMLQQQLALAEEAEGQGGGSPTPAAAQQPGGGAPG